MSIDSDLASIQSTIGQYSGTTGAGYGTAVAAMQAAGNHAASSTGPAIDALSGSNPAVMAITQMAWQGNASLAALPADDSASQDTVDAAASMLGGMLSQYTSAYQQASALGATPTPVGMASLTGKLAQLSALQKAVPRSPAAAGRPAPTAPFVPPVPAATPAPSYTKPLLIGGGVLLLVILLAVSLPHMAAAKGVAAVAAV
jgi:hypothetical protein